MLRRQPAALVVVALHGRRAAADIPLHRHHGDSQVSHLPGLHGAAADDDAGHAVALAHLQVFPLPGVLLPVVAEQDLVAPVRRRTLDIAHQLREVRVHDMGDDDPDRVGPLLRQGPGHLVGLIV